MIPVGARVVCQRIVRNHRKDRVEEKLYFEEGVVLNQTPSFYKVRLDRGIIKTMEKDKVQLKTGETNEG